MKIFLCGWDVRVTYTYREMDRKDRRYHSEQGRPANEDNIRDKDVRIGDKVVIRKRVILSPKSLPSCRRKR